MTKRHDDPATPALAGTSHVQAKRSLRETDDPLLLRPSQSFAPRCCSRPGPTGASRRAQSRRIVLVRACIGLAVVLGLGWSSAATISAAASDSGKHHRRVRRFDHRACHRQRGSAGAGCERVGQFDRDDVGATARRRRMPTGMYCGVRLAAGDYRVQFSPPVGSNLVSEYHPDTTDYSLAVPVKVSASCDGDGDRCVVGGWCFDHRAMSPTARVTRCRVSTCGPARPR